ncbi:kinase-like domain-containing protein [Rhizophagus irregularis DAOM 181602=DAOM 197198]|uniref:Cdc15p n=3 Tax=Rhizophagus irregularis TaxID=588596 RepID=A0A015MEL3_RHIIW|nr:Cdc15p [Rhizophagus irregularis DAOM 197198w]GBC41761.1 kinase-like domain-containing protein [Rhizophagus irregularis DAOM 181602=DAOM 197198]
MARLFGSIKIKYKSHNCKDCRSRRKNNKINPTANYVWCDVCSPIHLQREFSSWSSGNKEVDEFIKFQQLKTKKSGDLIEWIPYDRLSNIKYVAEGGFSKVYSASWLDGLIQGWNFEQKQWKRLGKTEVALKVLQDSQNISSEFLEELHLNLQRGSTYVAKCFGFTKEPKSNNYVMVLEYAENGNLRNFLTKSESIDWYQKVEILKQIGHHLCRLHEKEIIHKDFHIGNILYETNHRIDDFLIISDLGVCQPISKRPCFVMQSSEIYGVLPYMAPEVLKDHSYSKASNIYAFGGIIYEIVTGYPPFYNRPHDFQLALDICKGVHPDIPEHVPKSIANLILRCWEPNPKKRITAIEIFSMIRCCFIYEDENKLSPRLTKEIEEFKSAHQVYQAEQIKIHPEAVYISRLLSFPKLEESLKN